MKAVTANRLTDGVAVYLDANGAWTADLAQAASFEDGAPAKAALAIAEDQESLIVGPYLMDIDAAAPSGRARLREAIRAAGPTVRMDLGKQAEVA